MPLKDLAVVVLQKVCAVAVQHAGASALQAGGVGIALQPQPCGLDADQAHTLIADEGVEQTNGIRAPADGRHAGVRQTAGAGQHLFPGLAPDDALEVADHGRIGVRPRRRADDVEGVADVRDPVAHGLVHGLFQRRATVGDGPHLGPQQLHAEHIGGLTLDVGGAHIDDAGQAEAGADGGGRHPVLAGAGLGDDAGLAHAAGQQDLAHAVVDLVRAGVIQLIALEPDVGATVVLGQTLREIQRAGATDIVGQEVVQLGLERRIGARRVPGRFQLVDGGHQGFGDEPAAERTEPALGVRPGVSV